MRRFSGVLAFSTVFCTLTQGQCQPQWLSAENSGLGAGLNGAVHTICPLLDGTIFVGGSFTTAGGAPAERVAIWNGSSWAQMGSTGANARVLSSLVLENGDLIVGGSFTTINGANRPGVARWDGATWHSILGGFTRVPLGPDQPGDVSVYQLTRMPSGEIVAAGEFRYASGSPANNIAILSQTGWQRIGNGGSFGGGGTNSIVSALAVHPDGRLFAGGAFSSAGGVPAARIAAWNGTSWGPVGSGMNLGVSALLVWPNGDLLAGGSFSTAGGLPARGLAYWNGAWNSMNLFTNVGMVWAMAQAPNGDLWVGGQFATLGDGQTANHIARWNGSNWSALDSGLNTPVRRILPLPNGDVLVGGDFTIAGEWPAGRIAVWTENGPPIVELQPLDTRICVGGMAELSLSPRGAGPFAYRWRKDGEYVGSPHGDGPALTFSNVTASDAGAYDCVVTNACGSTTSSSARLILCAADFACDTSIDVSDIFAYLLAWFSHDPRADFDQLPGVTVDDLFQFLTEWFAGCP